MNRRGGAQFQVSRRNTEIEPITLVLQPPEYIIRRLWLPSCKLQPLGSQFSDVCITWIHLGSDVNRLA